jgi:hypothetical protein
MLTQRVVALVMMSIPVAAEAGEGRWIADKAGCLMWDASGESGERINWNGTCVDGYAEGSGTAIWLKGGDFFESDSGTWRRGMMEGRGTIKWAKGGRFEGEFRADLPNGRGTLYRNGIVYSGHWANGCFKQGSRRASVNVAADQCR